MDDYTYTRIQAERERKNLAHQGRSKKNGSKSRKCSLPSDHLTPKQIKAMNGEVSTFALNKPCTVEVLKITDPEIVEEYLQHLADRFNVTTVCVSRMLGMGEAGLYKLIRELGIRKPTRKSKFMTNEESEMWNAWLAQFGWESGYHRPELYPVDTQNIEPEETKVEDNSTEPSDSLTLDMLSSFTAEIHNPQQLNRLTALLATMLDKHGKLTLNVTT